LHLVRGLLSPPVTLPTLTSRWAIAVSLIALAAGSDAIADTRKGVLTVSATVVRTAEIATIDSLSFGSNHPTVPRTPITVRATKGMTYRIHVAAGSGADTLRGEPDPWAGSTATTRTTHGRMRRRQRVSAGRDVHARLVTIDW